jgi:hypothetical protein
MDFSRKVIQAEKKARKEDEYDHGESPFQVEEESDTPHESDQIAEHIDKGARKKPTKSLRVFRKSGHQISCLDVIEEGLGEVENPPPEIFLDVECYPLLKACKGEVFKHLDELFGQDEGDEQGDSTCQQPELAFQNHLIDDVPCDQRLGEGEKRGKEDEKKANASVSPVTKEMGLQVSKGLASAPVTLLTCDPVLRG